MAKSVLKSVLIMHNYSMDYNKCPIILRKTFGLRLTEADQNEPLRLLVQL